MGIYGVCRREEILNITLNNVNDRGDILIVTIPDTKNNTTRTFMVTDKITENLNPINMFKKYVALRPIHAEHQRLFVFYRNGKCSVQPIGKTK